MVEITKLQTSFSAGEISPRLDGRIDSDRYGSSCQSLINYLVTPFGAVSHRPGFKYIQPLSDQTSTARLVPFEYSNQDTYVLEFSNNKIRFYKNQGIILDSHTSGNPIYTVTTSYSTDELPNLRFAQSFDTMYITHQNHAPAKLVRVDNDIWTLSTVSFSEPPYQDINSTTTTITPSGTSGTITMTASSSTFVSTDVGRAIRYKAGVKNTATIHYPGTTGGQLYFDIPFTPNDSSSVQVNVINTNGSRTSLTYVSSSPTSGQYTIANAQVQVGVAPSTSEQIEIMQKNAGTGVWGWGIITGYTSSTQVTVSLQSPLNGTNASVFWRLGAWSQTTGYPQLCTFHEQRLWFANTTTAPNGLWGSASGDFENFSPDDANKQDNIAADTSVSYPLVTTAIQWIRGMKVLLVGCADGLIQIVGTTGAIAANSTPETKKDSAVKCAFAEPSSTSNKVIFLGLLGHKAYTTEYAFQIDGFMTTDLNTLSEHIGLVSPMTNIAYAETPSSVIWVLRDNGTLCSCTYVPDQNLIGWSNHSLGGTDVVVESMTVVTGATYSEVWAVVKRTINGSTSRYVECLQKEFFYDDVKNSIFSDASLTYNGSATSTVSGLSHLIGETVTVIADGCTHPDCVVNSSGQISLNSTYSVVQVGLYSPAILETQLIEGGATTGSSQGASSAITKCLIRYFETVGGTIGYDSTQADVVSFRTPTALMNNPIVPFSGDKIVPFSHGFDQGYKVYLTQPYALPSTVLMMLYKAKVGSM